MANTFFILFLVLSLFIFFIKRKLNRKKLKYTNYISLENIPQEFEEIYTNVYNNHILNLKKMEKEAKRTIVSQNIIISIIVLGIIFFIIMCLTVIDNVILFVACYPYFGLIFFIGTIILFCWSMNYEKKYVKFYKEEVITSFIKLINKELEYKPFGYGYFEQKEEYRKAKFDNKVFNSFNLDDYIEGFVDEQTFIKMCDLHIQHHTERGESTYAEEIFQGIFAQTKCGKDIGTYLKVSKNKIKILQQQDRVEMDSEEFEKYFDIYSENKIIAMQLLTSDIMEFLTDFYNKYKLDYEIVFRNNTIYMRFFTGPMFETNGNAMDKEILFKYFCIFKFVLEISKKVNKTLQEMEI